MSLSNHNAKILAIETSCDETSAAVVENGRTVLSNIVYSQIEIHKVYGGVVPEIASRNHVLKLPYVVDSALADAKLDFAQIDAFAVAYGPGLVGALLTGVSYAKALVYAACKPLIPVNHMEGHIAANYITHADLEPPFLCLVVSGGHTDLYLVEDYLAFTLLGTTRDDAAGEALDKIARVLGLPYPGGPNMEKLAKDGDPKAYPLPKSFRGEEHLDFSFSGIKTAVIHLLQKMEQTNTAYKKEDVAASFQSCVVDMLLENVQKAAVQNKVKQIVFAGGVSANTLLRERAISMLSKSYALYFPKLCYCTDNAAMIASQAYYKWRNHKTAGLDLNAVPYLNL